MIGRREVGGHMWTSSLLATKKGLKLKKECIRGQKLATTMSHGSIDARPFAVIAGWRMCLSKSEWKTKKDTKRSKSSIKLREAEIASRKQY